MPTVPQSIQEQIQMLEPSAVIELFQLHLTLAVNGTDTVYYYHAGTNEIYGNIVFNSITYSAVPCEMDGFKRSATGTLPRPTFTIANANSAISVLMASYNPLNAKVVRIRTCKKFLDAANFSSGSMTCTIMIHTICIRLHIGATSTSRFEQVCAINTIISSPTLKGS